jgi:uncharacterized membrane protein YjgN (DUF898 family)
MSPPWNPSEPPPEPTGGGKPGAHASIGLSGLTQPAGQAGVHPVVEPPAPPAAAAVDVPTTTSRGGQREYPVEFTGSGSEYFRIWIVNLLLTLVTLGLYFPWAKVRKLRYFYGNTRVANHTLDFHGDPWRMLRGYLLVSLLFGAYSVANNFSPIAGLVALAALALIWPALIQAGQRFRMSQTSWRGLRFAFGGTIGGAYKALLPAALPVVAMVAAVTVVALMQGPPRPRPANTPPAAPDWADAWPLVFTLALMLLIPWILWSIKRYQHGHYAFGRVRARFTAGPGAFYALFAKSSLVTIAVAMVAGTVFAIVAGGGMFMAVLGGAGNNSGGGRSGGPGLWMFVVFAVLGALAYLAIFWISRPYFTSRLQNLLWNRTDSGTLGFRSKLRFRSLLLLGLKNGLLTILTLGFYWPFAAIATAKMRLEAVTVLAHRDLDAIVHDASAASKDAAGDAAGDVFGIDIGL